MDVKELKALEERVVKAEEKSAQMEKDLEVEKAKRVTAPSIHTSNINSLEQQALRNFGCSHPKQLMEVNTGADKFKFVPQEQKELVKGLKEAMDVSRWTQQMFHGEQIDTFNAEGKGRIANVKGMLDNYYAKNELVGRLKAFGSTVANAGDEWVPTVVSASYIEEYQLDLKAAALFQSINMPSNPFNLPIQTSKTTARISSENTSFSASNFNTDVISLAAKKFQEFYLLPEELLEDSAPDFIRLGRADVINSIYRAEETAILNGDADGTHQDSDIQAGAADLAEKAFNGIRKAAIGNSANGATPAAAAALSDAFLRSMQKAMGRFGVSPRSLAYIVSPIGYQQMLGLTNVVTSDKFGPQATVLSGALAAYNGIPIVISEFLRDNLNVSGVYDGVTTDNSGILLVNRERFKRGIRRPIRMKLMQDLLDQDRMQVAAFSRQAFAHHAQSATEVSAVYGVDVTA